MSSQKSWRKTTQELLPRQADPSEFGQYDIYPAFPLAEGQIATGYRALAEQISGQQQVIIDGYIGIFWDEFCRKLDAELQTLGFKAQWVDVAQALHSAEAIDSLVEPFLGGDDPIFGTRFTGTLGDFFAQEKLRALTVEDTADLNIIYGCGAALAGWTGLLIYVDLPKNELQFRSRAGYVCNLGSQHVIPPKPMYKRFYFVDWVAFNQHKAKLLPDIDIIVDGQWPAEPVFMSGDDLRAGLTAMSQNYFRVRPWFEPGPWGGQWIKEKIPQLPQDVPNYAWSFELIVPENGLLFESNGRYLELSFDFLMYHNHRAILGDCAERFGYEFPIRFDFLDTVDGGNLSVQCHPRPEFITEHFGETFTQDETYYILDCGPGAKVYLGFQEDIDPAAFRAELERSFAAGTEVDIEKYVNVEAANKHDLFLIPNGTIHCSGTDNLVLEISATPYIFTFKMYDWLRSDLEGKQRPLNIERAFQNLYFERKGEKVKAELVAKPTVVEKGDGWQLVHLPTHSQHFYDVHRYEFDEVITIETNGSPHVLSLVEGEAVTLETASGLRQRFNYAETFVVPAAAGSYRLLNESRRPAWVVKAFIKS